MLNFIVSIPHQGVGRLRKNQHSIYQFGLGKKTIKLWQINRLHDYIEMIVSMRTCFKTDFIANGAKVWRIYFLNKRMRPNFLERGLLPQNEGGCYITSRAGLFDNENAD